MISKKQTTNISKFLSLILRHKPETIGIVVDQNGWTNVKSLLEKSNEYGIQFDLEILKHIVDTNLKKRFAFNSDFSKIRASQGHSLEIELGYTNHKPPQILFHGTSEKSVESIFENGIEKQKRQHVHLSCDIDTAIKVGQRHGKPFVFRILAEEMYNDKFEFYISDNNVWLTSNVPKKYLKRNVG
jgi:putative RNA 2'-phosphotransferase